MRTGFGYDIHRLAPGRRLILGGVRIEHDKGSVAHSDGDSVLHALCDAILGAIAAGDIGELFDPADPQWADADSRIFVEGVLKVAHDGGWKVGNCDITIIAEEPKLSPHRLQMRQNISRMLQVPLDAVSVKANTNEGLGEIGAGEAIAAVAVVVMVKD